VTPHDIVQEIAKAAVLADAADLPGLVSIQEQLGTLSGTVSAMPGVDELCVDCQKMIDSIVLRETDDADVVMSNIRSTIEALQDLVDREPDEEGSISTASGVDPELVDAWVVATLDNLGDLEAVLLHAENDGVTPDMLGDVRRRVHTLKGECGVLSLHDAARVCHDVESRIDRALDSDEPFPIDLVFAFGDWLKSYVQLIAESIDAPPPPVPDFDSLDNSAPSSATVETSTNTDSSSTPATEMNDGAGESASEATTEYNDTTPVTIPNELQQDENIGEFISESTEHLGTAEASLLALENDPTDLELINAVFRAFHTIKGVAGFMHLEAIVEVAHNAEYLLDCARSEKLVLGQDHLDLALRSCDMLAKLLGMLQGQPAPTVGELRYHVDELRHASNPDTVPPPAGAPTIAASAPEPKGERALTKDAAPEAPPVDAAGAARRRSFETSVKVSTKRMDSLVNMVGELVIAHQMVVQDPNIQIIDEQRAQRNLSQCGKIIRDLQEVAMSLRMVTLKGTFQKMSRLVRDVSSRAGKTIRLQIEGEDTELDRTVVEEIADPLVHMIRNSCDHGIEPADERIAAGKSPEGRLVLRAFHRDGSIIIEVEDDGRGLNREKILSKAQERGLLENGDPAEMTDQEVWNLIFLPGFSTADKVTEVSGRGVGMDVVRRNIESLRGKVEIKSSPGQGSTIRMRLPLTMAIIDGMVVGVGEDRFVLPTLSIVQSFRPREGDVQTVVGRGEMVSVRGALLPIYRLSEILNIAGGMTDPTQALLIVIESHDMRFTLMVDEILYQQQVVIKSLGQGIGNLPGVSGGAILGDGRVALILDVAGLVKVATTRAAAQRHSAGVSHVSTDHSIRQ